MSRNVLRNTDECFHVWANNPNTSGRSGNVSFGGGTLFSYSMIIARLFTNADGIRAAIVTGDSYGVTTAKHKGAAHGAARVSFGCPDGYVLTERTTPADVRAGWADAIARKAADYSEARSKPSKAKAFRELVYMVEQADKLAEYFDLPRFDRPPEDATVTAYMEGHAARELARRAAPP